MHLLITVVVVLILAGVFLWALQQLPIDATMKQLARVVIIVAAVIWLVYVLLHLTGTSMGG